MTRATCSWLCGTWLLGLRSPIRRLRIRGPCDCPKRTRLPWPRGALSFNGRSLSFDDAHCAPDSGNPCAEKKIVSTSFWGPIRESTSRRPGIVRLLYHKCKLGTSLVRSITVTILCAQNTSTYRAEAPSLSLARIPRRTSREKIISSRSLDPVVWSQTRPIRFMLRERVIYQQKVMRSKWDSPSCPPTPA